MEEKEKTRPKEKMVRMTLRMDESMNEVLEKVSASSGMAKSEVVRFALADRLADYLGNVIYPTAEDAMELRKSIYDACTKMSDVYRQLSYIGRNFNQYVRNQNTAKKSGMYYYDRNGKTGDETLEQVEAVMRQYTKDTQDVMEAVRCLTRQ